jgi:hypothetical protein
MYSAATHQEEVVDVRYVAGGAGRPVLLKQPHQVAELPVQVAEQLDRRCVGTRASASR